MSHTLQFKPTLSKQQYSTAVEPAFALILFLSLTQFLLTRWLLPEELIDSFYTITLVYLIQTLFFLLIGVIFGRGIAVHGGTLFDLIVVGIPIVLIFSFLEVSALFVNDFSILINSMTTIFPLLIYPLMQSMLFGALVGYYLTTNLNPQPTDTSNLQYPVATEAKPTPTKE